jgi:hypothetical protein
MDSSDLAVQELLGFSCVRPLRTVASFLEERGRPELLDDPLMEVRDVTNERSDTGSV